MKTSVSFLALTLIFGGAFALPKAAHAQTTYFQVSGTDSEADFAPTAEAYVSACYNTGGAPYNEDFTSGYGSGNLNVFDFNCSSDGTAAGIYAYYEVYTTDPWVY